MVIVPLQLGQETVKPSLNGLGEKLNNFPCTSSTPVVIVTVVNAVSVQPLPALVTTNQTL